jgi:hypothetical protein
VEDLWTSAKDFVEKRQTFSVHLDFQVLTQIFSQINGGDKKK